VSIWVGTHLLGLHTYGFAAVNVVLTAISLVVAWQIRHLNLARSGAIESAPLQGATPAPST